MLKHDPNYRRLPVTGRSMLGKSTYWLAPDHLLVVEIQAVVESYRRFELKDVQALELAPGFGSKVLNWALGIALAALLGGAAASLAMTPMDPDTVAVLIASGVVSAGLGMVLGLSLWAGPSCRFTLRTAVQSVVLPGISRRRKAERLWAELQPAIARVQAGQGIAPSSSASELAPQPASPDSPAAS